jgi:hypothetical protein
VKNISLDLHQLFLLEIPSWVLIDGFSKRKTPVPSISEHKTLISSKIINICLLSKVQIPKTVIINPGVLYGESYAIPKACC